MIENSGKPIEVRCDYGPEFTSAMFTEYAVAKNIHVKFIQPGNPTQNAYIERFNRSYREELPDAYLFCNIEEARELTEQWRNDYNENHPHQSFNNNSPLNYLKQNTNFKSNL